MALDSHLAQAKISQLDVSLSVDEHILWLQISVQNVHLVEMLQSQQNIGSVKLGCILLKSANLTEIEEQLASGAVLQTEEQLGLRLEGVVHLHDVGVVHTFKNASLIHGMLKLVSLQNLVLL